MTTKLLSAVDDGNFAELFIRQLGWNAPAHSALRVDDGFGNTFEVAQVASYRGMGVWACASIPSLDSQRLIDSEVAKKTLERLIIYTDGDRQEWRWPRSTRRGKSGPPTLVPHRHTVGHSNPSLVERLELIRIPVDGQMTVPELLDLMREAFDREAETASKQAARLMGSLYERLEIAGMGEQESSIFLARMLFLMFGDDTGMWKKSLFHDFLAESTKTDGSDLRQRLSEAFEAANTAERLRRSDLPKALESLPYINGGVFAEELRMPELDGAFRKALIEACRFDWGQISPAVFGSMFQTVKSKEARRHLGEHYTTEENILKTIEPLFLDDLRERLDAAWDDRKALAKLHRELGEMRFLDPACGCGNFLIVAYRELRALELALLIRQRDLASEAGDPKAMQLAVDATQSLKVSIEQFYGIEIEPWPARIAETAMFLVDHQANIRMDHELGTAPTRLPLEVSPHIHLGNALTTDWESLLAPGDHVRVMGNPPFLGSRLQTAKQKEERWAVWGDVPKSASLDYVTNWLLLAARFLRETRGRAAFVATSSISQGEQPAILWPSLKAFGMGIDFAHRPFSWSSEAPGAAAVDVVIIGFSSVAKPASRLLWLYPDPEKSGEATYAANINAYLLDAPDILVSARASPRLGIPRLRSGNVPRDGGWLSKISDEEANAIRESDPVATKFLRRLYGSEELIQGTVRWCLWLVGAKPEEIRKSPVLADRVSRCQTERLGKPGSKGRAAATPALFADIHQPEKRFLCVPSVSSELREYIPIAYLEPRDVVSNAVFFLEDLSPYWFGLLSSSVFTSWVKAVSSRLESRIQIAAGPVYNSFPFVRPSDDQRNAVEASAADVLTARAAHPGLSLADLYDPLGMPRDLRDAHKAIDRAVLALYGLEAGSQEAEVLTSLFTAYGRLEAAERRASGATKKMAPVK